MIDDEIKKLQDDNKELRKLIAAMVNQNGGEFFLDLFRLHEVDANCRLNVLDDPFEKKVRIWVTQ